MPRSTGPLTSYYLLLGASALLLTIGLIMVLSASSVYSYEVNDGDSYAVVRRQLVWVLIGLPLAWVASRLPHRWVRRLAYPGFSVSLVLLLLTAFFGVERNGNQNWLGVGPVVIQPSEIAKLAMVIWAAHIYANKERRLSQHPRDRRAGGAGHDPGHRPGGARQRPRHGPGAVRAAAGLAVGGRCAAAVLHGHVLGRRRRSLRPRRHRTPSGSAG